MSVLPLLSSEQTRISHQNHLIEFDYVRVIAMIFVIAVHALVVIDFKDSVSLFYFQLMQIIFFTCNGMFFLISGKFALVERPSLYQYYLKKIICLGIPILIFFYVRTIWGGGVYFFNLLGELADTEYWFLYVLMGNIALAPLLAKAFVNFNQKECWIFLIFGLFTHFMMTICSIFQINYSWSYVFSGYALYFYLGACVEKIFCTKKSKYALFLIAAGGVCVSLVLKYNGVTNYVHDISPIFAIITLGVYFAILQVVNKFKRRLDNINKLVTFVAKHSFVVYLVHMMILELIIRNFSQTWVGPFSILYHVITTSIVFIVSFVIAVVANKFFLNPICSRLIRVFS